jgi:FkbM family methyltransferase
MFRILKRLLRRGLARRGWALVPRPQPLLAHPAACLEASFDLVLSHYLVHQARTPYFVQIGAFNGVDGDPLYPYVKKGLLKGCLLEPQPDVFEQLRLNYAGVGGLLFKRAAIGPRPGQATLYRVRPGAPGPPWLHQIASFRREVVLRHAPIVPNLEAMIVTEEVQTVTFEELFAELGVLPDIVVVDTEGYDYEILKLLDVPARKPRVLLYEHKHLNDFDRDACLELLIGAGYRIGVGSVDTTAYLPDE